MNFFRLKPLSAEFMADEATLQITLLIPARDSAGTMSHTVQKASQFLAKFFPDQYEIILIPNGANSDCFDQTVAVAAQLAQTSPRTRSVVLSGNPGKGAALRSGLVHAKGSWIFLTDADLPYELDFFVGAASALKEGASFVTGNRRLPESYFDLPAELLPLAYKRHTLGLLFNWVVRLLFSLSSSDTQAGIKAMTRQFARNAFLRVQCPGFFFDLELFLVAQAREYRHVELPVTLYLNSEKSTVRILREGVQAAYWLTRISRDYWKGYYSI